MEVTASVNPWNPGSVDFFDLPETIKTVPLS
jgi:hypothetical protein